MGGKRDGKRASALEKVSPRRRLSSTSCNMSRTSSRRSLRASASSASISPSPPSSRASSSCAKVSSENGAERDSPRQDNDTTGAADSTRQPWRPASTRALAASAASTSISPTAPASRTPFTRKRMASPVADVGGLALAARAAVLAVGEQIELAALLAGAPVLIGVAPGIGGHRLLEIRPGPARLAGRLGHQRLEPLLGRRIVADVEPVFVEGLFQRIDLRARDLDFRLADLGEIARCNIARQQADDDHDDKQLQQREAGLIRTRAACNTPMQHSFAPYRQPYSINRMMPGALVIQ